MTDATHATAKFDPLDDDDEFPDELLPRPRRRFLTPWTALAMAMLLGAVGFYVGIRVEKANGSTSTSGFSSLLKSRAATSGKSRGFPNGGAAGFSASASANGTTGSISSIDGNTLYVKESSGNIVKVRLSSATKITKTETVSKAKVYPGDEVTVSGDKRSGGGIAAITITDTGASSSSSSSSSSGNSSSSSAVSSLFGG